MTGINKTGAEMDNVTRWRLVLGDFAEDAINLDGGFGELNDTLEFLYGREYGEGSGVRKEGGRGASVLTVPDWIRRVRKLFPKRTVELLQKEALDRYKLTELLTDPAILRSMEPNMNLLKSILNFKDIIPAGVKNLAYEIIEKAVRDIQKKLEAEIRRVFSGKKLPNSTSPFKVARNFDIKKTIRKNLKYYSKEYKTVVAEKLFFNQNVKRYNPWNVIILVDESGSMLDSVIYSSVMAGIFAKLPFLNVKLVVFDTSVVDLSGSVDDPVGILMKVQLGGGTDIAKALKYGKQLVSAPAKTVVVLVSDLFDGGDYRRMYQSARDIVESGARLLILTALDYSGSEGSYDKTAARHMAQLGAHTAALNPEDLASWIGKVIS
jgi:Mg-chelatase subunit ChlD